MGSMCRARFVLSNSWPWKYLYFLVVLALMSWWISEIVTTYGFGRLNSLKPVSHSSEPNRAGKNVVESKPTSPCLSSLQGEIQGSKEPGKEYNPDLFGDTTEASTGTD